MIAPLFAAAVPPARAALARAGGLLDRVAASGRRDELLAARLAPDALPCGAQLRTVAGFALRACLPLAGHPLPQADFAADSLGLAARLAWADRLLAGLSPGDFAGAEARLIRHRAGFADLEQSGADYLHLFAMPNLWFHLAQAHAILRSGGLAVGKADFDNLHDYPAGFRWPD